MKDSTLLTLGEFDFIIISSTSKSVIQIEAKRGNNEKNRQHAEKQLHRGQEFFSKNVPYPSSENWKYIKLMCFGESVEIHVCKNCKPFILGSNFIKDETIQSVSEELSHQFYSFLKTVSNDNSTGTVGILKIHSQKSLRKFMKKYS